MKIVGWYICYGQSVNIPLQQSSSFVFHMAEKSARSHQFGTHGDFLLPMVLPNYHLERK
jgi:hypothetical protein